MSALALRSINPGLAMATRALGAGASLPFVVGGVPGVLTLQLGLAGKSGVAGLWLNTAVGALWLSDAGAVLSLLSETPVITDGPTQPWYWQFISQQLSPALAQGLAPLEPLAAEVSSVGLPPTSTPERLVTEPAMEQLLVHCRLQVHVGEEQLYAYLSAAPDTLLRWLQVPGWQHSLQPLAASFNVPFALVLGRASLTAEQLASLRPGDVLLPQQCLFDTQGNGHVTLADRRWNSHITDDEGHLYLTLSHEEYSNHE